MDQFQTGYKFMKIKIININKVCFSVLFFLSVFGIQCGSKESEPCDYIYLAELMLDKIKTNDKNGAIEMMASFDKKFWKEGSDWEMIKKSVMKSLETKTTKERVRPSIAYFRNSSISYAVVTFILAKNGSVIDFLEVRFFNPKSPYKCKIEFFDFKRNGAKEIFIKPDDPNSHHKK